MVESEKSLAQDGLSKDAVPDRDTEAAMALIEVGGGSTAAWRNEVSTSSSAPNMQSTPSVLPSVLATAPSLALPHGHKSASASPLAEQVELQERPVKRSRHDAESLERPSPIARSKLKASTMRSASQPASPRYAQVGPGEGNDVEMANGARTAEPPILYAASSVMQQPPPAPHRHHHHHHHPAATHEHHHHHPTVPIYAHPPALPAAAHVHGVVGHHHHHHALPAMPALPDPNARLSANEWVPYLEQQYQEMLVERRRLNEVIARTEQVLTGLRSSGAYSVSPGEQEARATAPAAGPSPLSRGRSERSAFRDAREAAESRWHMLHNSDARAAELTPYHHPQQRQERGRSAHPADYDQRAPSPHPEAFFQRRPSMERASASGADRAGGRAGMYFPTSADDSSLPRGRQELRLNGSRSVSSTRLEAMHRPGSPEQLHRQQLPPMRSRPGSPN